MSMFRIIQRGRKWDWVYVSDNGRPLARSTKLYTTKKWCEYSIWDFVTKAAFRGQGGKAYFLQHQVQVLREPRQ